jgi:hypothetical protein
VPVIAGETRHEPNRSALVKALVASESILPGAASSEVYSAKRKEVGKAAHNSLDISAVAKALENFYSNHDQKRVHFPHFNEKFYKLCALFENNPKAPFRGPTGGFSLFYKELYSCYWSTLNSLKNNSKGDK